MEGFWTKGREQFLKALRREERERLAPLQDRLKSEDDPEIRRRLRNEIKALQDKFTKKRKAAGSSLFLRG